MMNRLTVKLGLDAGGRGRKGVGIGIGEWGIWSKKGQIGVDGQFTIFPRRALLPKISCL